MHLVLGLRVDYQAGWIRFLVQGAAACPSFHEQQEQLEPMFQEMRWTPGRRDGERPWAGRESGCCGFTTVNE